ncbi:hypothetical protein EGW08_012909 [Elysia chlorotica]|uniref:OTU domain-containing protein n=1 Tax=Elysia chlorotica TaxID=188477 RepID=A0A433TD07_ELYCH|nr:hypothetical protein EGW08_012909 [Elysia chlorotica]
MSRWSRRGQCYGRMVRPGHSDRHREESPVFRPIGVRWQERQCRRLGLPLVTPLQLARPRPAPSLRHREPSLVIEIGGDGNCLFRCLSLNVVEMQYKCLVKMVITGSENHHTQVRQRIVSHIAQNCKAFSALLPESPRRSANGSRQEHADACAQYLSTSKMAAGATWGSDVEILAAAHLLRTRIFVYTLHGPAWQWVEHGLELTDPGRKPSAESVYLVHTDLVHYDLVEDTTPVPPADETKGVSRAQGLRSQNLDRHIGQGVGAKAARSRGYSVSCTRADTSPTVNQQHSSSSCYSSSCSSSTCSIDGKPSCGESESVGSAQASQRNASVPCSRQRRPGLSCRDGTRFVVPCRDGRQRLAVHTVGRPKAYGHTHRNNNNSFLNARHMNPTRTSVNCHTAVCCRGLKKSLGPKARSSLTPYRRCSRNMQDTNSNKENIQPKVKD